MPRVTEPTTDTERCLIFKISFTEAENSWKYQNITEEDIAFLVENNQMQRFFNSAAADICEEEGFELPDFEVKELDEVE